MLTAVAGYLFFAVIEINFVVFIGLIIGMILIISSACALNNYLDQDIDSKMIRTKKRPSVLNAISKKNIIIFVVVLFLLGFIFLFLLTNLITAIIGAIGYITYVWFYGAWAKRKSMHGTLVGSISGATPILGGYTAASNKIDNIAIILFLILFFWQFWEFYSIAIYRKKEYIEAKVPVMPAVVGNYNTIWQIIIYINLYVISTLILIVFVRISVINYLVLIFTGAIWIIYGVKGLFVADQEKWAKQMFKYSLYSLLLLCIMLSVDKLLPI